MLARRAGLPDILALGRASSGMAGQVLDFFCCGDGGGSCANCCFSEFSSSWARLSCSFGVALTSEAARKTAMKAGFMVNSDKV